MGSIFGVDHPVTPAAKALRIPGISAPSFWRVDGGQKGTVHDEEVNQVYELRSVLLGWIVLDEWCIEHFGITIRHAILKARSANQRRPY